MGVPPSRKTAGLATAQRSRVNAAQTSGEAMTQRGIAQPRLRGLFSDRPAVLRLVEWDPRNPRPLQRPFNDVFSDTNSMPRSGNNPPTVRANGHGRKLVETSWQRGWVKGIPTSRKRLV